MFKNMKIEINEDQPIDDVVKELERLGLNLSVRQLGRKLKKQVTFIGVFNNWFEYFTIQSSFWDGEEITLQQLKEM